ncbi:MAG: T9SS type A sorting domain-containing protein [Lewinellaceae bacterium]|nr:T9SS type A sorting domain-containing protein [Lewinellaceae bacterium]
MKYLPLLIFLLLAAFQQSAAQFTVRLVVDDNADQLLVQIKNTSANIPTTSHRISSINMRLLGSGVSQITNVSSNYTMLLPSKSPPDPISGIITMNSTSLISPENWIQNQYVTVAAYGLNPGVYTPSSFSVQPDTDGDNSDVDDPIMSVQTAGFFNIPLNIEPSAPLPVELIYFSAQAKDGDALLRWATATELNNEGFEVQRSADGRSFQKIGWEDGHGTSQELRQYAFEDRGISPGVHYYRLKQVDLDGKFEFSEVRSVSSTGNAPPVVAYPNPTDGFVYFSAAVKQKGLALSLFDAKGQLLGRQVIDQNYLDLSRFPAGLYFLYIDDGSRKDLIKVLKR